MSQPGPEMTKTLRFQRVFAILGPILGPRGDGREASEPGFSAGPGQKEGGGDLTQGGDMTWNPSVVR